jgi:lipoate-protein ligase A
MKDENRNGRSDVLPYVLPDAVLFERSGCPLQCLVWRPERVVVVIGKGSDPALEVKVEAATRDSIPVVRRGTGGCAVVLSPEMLVASFVVRQEKQLPSREYFRLFNSLIIEALSQQGIAGLEHKGTSDIAINGRKIAGTAIYRNRNLVFFHGILNVSGETDAMEKYLKVPPHMPEYRSGRSHSDFVTSLAEQGYALDSEQFSADLQSALSRARPDLLATQPLAVKS